jgi:hypothetical protein
VNIFSIADAGFVWSLQRTDMNVGCLSARGNRLRAC